MQLIHTITGVMVEEDTFRNEMKSETGETIGVESGIIQIQDKDLIELKIFGLLKRIKMIKRTF